MRRPRRVALRLLAVLLVATGASVLIQEQAFQVLLSTVVGSATPAAAIVLGVFFTGMILGAGIGARAARGSARPLLLYAAFEAGVGGWALLLACGFPRIQEWSAGVVHQAAGASALGLALARLIVACLWILPPSVCAGATFPIVAAVLSSRLVRRLPRILPRLYAANLAGAVGGSALAAFVLFPRLGLTRSLFLVAGLQALACAGAVLLDRRRRGSAPVPPGPRRDPRRSGQGRLEGRGVLAGGAFASGFCFFGFEVLWLHLVGSVIGSSVYSVGTMLTVVLGGLSLGGALAARLLRASPVLPAWMPAAALLACAGALLATFPGWPGAARVLEACGPRLHSFVATEALRFSIAAVLIGPPAAALALVYPCLFRLRPFLQREAPAAAAGLQAFNAAGCVVGAVATGLIFLPRLGSETVYRCLTVVIVLVAAASLLPARAARRTSESPAPIRFLAIAAVLGGALAMTLPHWDRLALTSGLQLYLRPAWVVPESRLLFFREDVAGGFTTVVENPVAGSSHRVRVLLADGKLQGDDGSSRQPQALLGFLPALHQAHLGRAAVIGLGTGQSSHVLAASGYGRVDIAEISPAVAEAARLFFEPINHGVLRSPATRLHAQDGRNFLLREDGPFDLIAVQVNSAWFPGSANLYSREFYELARRRLSDGGVFEQWLPLHHVRLEDVAGAVATLRGVFPHVTLWNLGDQGYLIASVSPLEIDPLRRRALATSSELESDREALRSNGGPDLDGIGQCLLLDEQGVSDLAALARRRGIPISTDSNRRLEFALPRGAVEGGEETAALLQELSALSAGGPAGRSETR